MFCVALYGLYNSSDVLALDAGFVMPIGFGTRAFMTRLGYWGVLLLMDNVRK